MTLSVIAVLDGGRVKHYKLKKLDNGYFFVSRTKSFETLKQLIQHYSRQADGLCVRLGKPCKKVPHTLASCLCFVICGQIIWRKIFTIILWKRKKELTSFIPNNEINANKSDCLSAVGGSTDSRSVLQHRGPVGDRSQLHQAAGEAGSRAVWGGLWGRVERHHSSRGEDPQTW